MTFQYLFQHNEANFGRPIPKPISGGMHITLEIVLRKGKKIIALRRNSIPGHEPSKNNNKLFFCHDLIFYGESITHAMQRIVKKQTGVNVKNYKLVYIDSCVQKKDHQWAFTPHILAEVEAIPKKGIYGNEIKEVIIFEKNAIPNDFAWWTTKDLRAFFAEAEL